MPMLLVGNGGQLTYATSVEGSGIEPMFPEFHDNAVPQRAEFSLKCKCDRVRLVEKFVRTVG